MHVIISGGSLIGLMHGIIFKHHGWDVEIYEQTLERLQSQAAGLTTGANISEFLVQHDRIKRKLTLDTSGMQEIDTSDKVLSQIPLPRAMTTWDALWFRLRSNFDGLTSVFEPEPAESRPGDGSAAYRNGRRIVSVGKHGDDGASVTFENVVDGKTSTVHADLLIAADGANSAIRTLLAPEAKGRAYAGYVLWRGIVPTSGLKSETVKLCNDWFSFCTVPQNREYVLLYPVPGKTGSLEDGDREMNFAWYSRMTSDELDEALTSIDGHRHKWSVPHGKLNPVAWQRQLRQRGGALNKTSSDVIGTIDRPFLQVIGDHMASKASYLNGRVLIVGDALATIRPHTGLGVSTGAFHALHLEKVLFGSKYSSKSHAAHMRDWETVVLDHSYMEYLKSISWGEYYLGSWFSWLVAAGNYHGRVKAREWQTWLSKFL